MEIRRFYDRLISTMGFPILVRRHLYIESAWQSRVWLWLTGIHVHFFTQSDEFGNLPRLWFSPFTSFDAHEEYTTLRHFVTSQMCSEIYWSWRRNCYSRHVSLSALAIWLTDITCYHGPRFTDGHCQENITHRGVLEVWLVSLGLGIGVLF